MWIEFPNEDGHFSLDLTRVESFVKSDENTKVVLYSKASHVIQISYDEFKSIMEQGRMIDLFTKEQIMSKFKDRRKL